MKFKFPLFLVAVIIVGSVIFASFERYYLLKDYWINTEVECDPSIESCFVYKCDSEIEECTGNEEDTSYYKNISILASHTPDCDPTVDDCVIKDCKNIEEAYCEVILCDNEGLEEGEKCMDPNSYSIQGTEEIDGNQEIMENEELERIEIPSLEGE